MKRTMAFLAALPLSTNVAAAQSTAPTQTWPENWYGGYNHMMWGNGYGMAGGLMMLVFWGAIIALIVFAIRWFDGGSGSARAQRKEALDVLRHRFAKGEIDEDEFRSRKAALEE